MTSIVRDLREALELTQQGFAVAMGSAISTVVRYEHGARPNLRQLMRMLELARTKKLEALAAEIQLHLNVALGPEFPLTQNPNERLCVALARRINQNPKRRDAFFKWAAPEMEQLRAENELRAERADELFDNFDAYAAEQLKKGGARRG